MINILLYLQWQDMAVITTDLAFSRDEMLYIDLLQESDLGVANRVWSTASFSHHVRTKRGHLCDLPRDF